MNNKLVTKESKWIGKSDGEETIAVDEKTGEVVGIQNLEYLNVFTGEISGSSVTPADMGGKLNYGNELGNMFSRTLLVSFRRLRNENGMSLGASADEVERNSVV